MAWGFVAAAAITVVGGVIQSDAAGDVADSQIAANRTAIDEQRAAREQMVELLAPFRELGVDSMEELRELLFNPTAGLDEINPIVSILRDQGFEAIQESAAAGGRLGAGGTLKDLTQFNSDLTTTVIPQLQNQRFNQLFNVVSMGQNAAAGQGTGILNTANNISGFQTDIGRARGDEAINQSNIRTNALGNFSGLVGQKSASESGGNSLSGQVDDVFNTEGLF